MTNAVNGEDEHYVHATGTVTFRGVKVTKPASRECSVYTDNAGSEGAEGVIDTEELTATSAGQVHSLLFTPANGNVFATFFVTCNKPVAALEGTWTVEGEVTGTVDGATINFSGQETTEQGTLIIKGHAAGIEGTMTIKGRANSGEGYTPLSYTTVET